MEGRERDWRWRNGEGKMGSRHVRGRLGGRERGMEGERREEKDKKRV